MYLVDGSSFSYVKYGRNFFKDENIFKSKNFSLYRIFLYINRGFLCIFASLNFPQTSIV